MKKLIHRIIMAAVALIMSAGAQAQQITIEDVAGGKFRPASIRSVRPLDIDGESYASISADGARIEKCSFKTGEVTEVLFDKSTARGANINIVEGYIISPDGKNILIETDRTPI